MKHLSTQAVGFAVAMLAGAAFATQPLELAGNAPERHVVVKGDTLWDIAGKFLQKPWRWPEIWQLNREQIANPHLIYPGDVIYLDLSGGTPRLRLGKPVGTGGADGGTLARTDLRTEQARPAVRSEPIAAAPVPTIAAHLIEPFLTRPLIVDPQTLKSTPRIVATQDGRVHLARGDLAYARGIAEGSATDWHVYRGARPLLDPDTRKPIAWEAQFVGAARLERSGDPATLRITAATEEIGTGDRLLPAEPASTPAYVPRPPEATLNARIVSVHRGVAQAGRNSVVALNAGSADGLGVGHVLAIKERGRVKKDRETGDAIVLPGQSIGHLLVFRVFDKIAYGLIMRSSRDVSVGDDVTNP